MSTRTRTGRPLGSGVRWPFYALKPGEACVVTGNWNSIGCALHHIRKSRGWTIISRKIGVGFEVRRLS